MESSWQNITRRLDINQVERDTTYDKSRTKGRAIRKVPLVFTIPAQTLTGAWKYKTLIHQMNCTASRAFKIINIENTYDNEQGIVPSCVMCIRYRVGGTVYRYRIGPSNVNAVAEALVGDALKSAVQTTVYAGQTIQPNFVIEWWHAQAFNFFNIKTSTLNITTNRLALPADADELNSDVLTTDATQVERDEITVALPEAIPTTYPASSQWLTN